MERQKAPSYTNSMNTAEKPKKSKKQKAVRMLNNRSPSPFSRGSAVNAYEEQLNTSSTVEQP